MVPARSVGLEEWGLAVSAKMAVLGLVIEQPGYGYSLIQRLEDRCGAWGWEGSGVYGALNLLERDGHVRADREKGRVSGRAVPRVIYDATPKGVGYFDEWLSKWSPGGRVREELELKLVFFGPESAPSLIEQCRIEERECLGQLHELRRQPASRSGRGSREWREAAAVLTRNGELKYLQARVEWLQDARKTMEELLSRSGFPLLDAQRM
jgi:DNA-binding PadR family transcriptional regulator